MAIQAMEPEQERRAGTDSRSNIFVVATIASAEAFGPVRVRNMSPYGALIEAAVLPAAGSPVRVSRGHLTASGIVAWHSGNRAGVRFDSAISLADWLPRGVRTQQQQIDELVYSHKSGTSPRGMAAAGSLTPKRASDVRNELLELEQTLRRVAEDLAQDMPTCERHLAQIQLIDVAAQRLAALAAIST
ncbi:hypothetical protein [Sphingomonas sp.]|uniref:hypothetical protein n=1 Tax=Sphingomonas sp. TaxID=28214 RepID=UPI0038A58903